jgi:hypothetical protein
MKPYEILLKQSTQWRGKERNKMKGLMSKPKKLGGLIKGVRKSHVFDPPPTCHKKHVIKREGKDFRKNI